MNCGTVIHLEGCQLNILWRMLDNQAWRAENNKTALVLYLLFSKLVPTLQHQNSWTKSSFFYTEDQGYIILPDFEVQKVVHLPEIYIFFLKSLEKTWRKSYIFCCKKKSVTK